jgi:hypothetical protein
MQKWNKSHEHFKRIPWMTKQIRKGDNLMTISLCPSCMAGEPWIIHSQNSYMTIHKVQENRDANSLLVIAKTKLKTSKGWPKLPKEIPTYKKIGLQAIFR